MPDSKVKRDSLTPEELDLLATPDEELRNRTKTFSFDRERFKARISSGERWQQLLQAHLYFDHVITQLLVDALANPDVINAQRMGFVQKLQLIQALGLLNSDLVPPVEFINGLRNKFKQAIDAGYRPYLPYAFLAATEAAKGNDAEAKSALAETRRLNPQLTIKRLLENWPVPPMIVEGLRKAGLPEE